MTKLVPHSKLCCPKAKAPRSSRPKHEKRSKHKAATYTNIHDELAKDYTRMRHCFRGPLLYNRPLRNPAGGTRDACHSFWTYIASSPTIARLSTNSIQVKHSLSMISTACSAIARNISIMSQYPGRRIYNLPYTGT
jgi:hypothetical protein